MDRKKPGPGRQVQRDSVCRTVLERQTYSARKTDGRVFFPSLLTHVFPKTWSKSFKSTWCKFLVFVTGDGATGSIFGFADHLLHHGP